MPPYPVQYIRENKDTHEIKISTYLMMIILIIMTILFSTGIITIEKAGATSIPMQQYQYHVAPRLFKNCNESFIGYNYDPTKEKPCRKLWKQWKNEMFPKEIISYTYTKEIPYMIIM